MNEITECDYIRENISHNWLIDEIKFHLEDLWIIWYAHETLVFSWSENWNKNLCSKHSEY